MPRVPDMQRFRAWVAEDHELKRRAHDPALGMNGWMCEQVVIRRVLEIMLLAQVPHPPGWGVDTKGMLTLAGGVTLFGLCFAIMKPDRVRDEYHLVMHERLRDFVREHHVITNPLRSNEPGDDAVLAIVPVM